MTQVEEGTPDEVDNGEEPGASYWAGRRGPDREEMVNAYLPDPDDWPAKTILDLNDPGRVAVLKQFGLIFPEVQELQPMIDDFLDEFLKAKTSTAGKSRDEYQRIFESMYGGHPDEKKGFGLGQLLAAEPDDD